MRLFYGVDPPNTHTKAKVVWDEICVLKSEGGLGIRRMH